MRRLEPGELIAVCDPATLPFKTTDDLTPLDDVIGQERAVSAMESGIGITDAGYNLFALGPAATGKMTMMQRLLTRAAAGQPSTSDYCYVHNFTDPDRPLALELPCGRGKELRGEMARLVEECKTRLPRAFESEEFERQRSQGLEDLGRRQEEEIGRLEAAARAEGFAVVRVHGGLGVAPAPEGRPLTREEFAALPESQRERLGAGAQALEERVEATLRQMRRLERDAREAHDKLVREVATAATRQLISELRERFAGLPAVGTYLDAVEHDLVERAEQFRAREEGKPVLAFLPPPDGFMDRYRVNVLVDRGDASGAPVVLEPNPTHGNLLGRIEHRAHFGTLVTDFTLIKPGALHKANGGYLLLEAKEVLRNFLAWDALKKALKSRSIRIQEPLEELRLVNVVTLAPEPIPLDVKVVLVGTPLLYYLLYNLDEDFRELFKIKVDFDESLLRSPDTEMLYARFIAASCRELGLPPFTVDAVARLVEHGSRVVEHQGRLTARLGMLRDVLREAAFCARHRGAAQATRDDVTAALTARVHRANLIEERIGRHIAEGNLLLSTAGAAVGQINGISVLSTGDHVFGRPSRITVSTYAGQRGVVDIEREAKLGGRTHSKGVMILTGFLAGHYAREHPLALSASIAFEQQYEEVDGDSASSAELYALLSSLAGMPLSQELAVTGSVNQQGEIQPVGAINEKIEGFFDACRIQGLTGRQGVLIPEGNARHLMLREDVVEAVRQGRFAIHAVATVEEGLTLLSGREAGCRGVDGRFPPGTFNAAVDEALARGVERWRQLRMPAASGVGGHDGDDNEQSR